MSDSADHLTHLQSLVAGLLGDAGGAGGAEAGPKTVQHYADPKKHKKPTKKTPKEIEHERDQKRAGTVYHNQQKKQESRKGAKFSHTIKWVKPSGAKRGKWMHDTKGTHTYTHHADGTHTITSSVKEMRERLHARVLSEAPAFGHGTDSDKAKKLYISHRKLTRELGTQPGRTKAGRTISGDVSRQRQVTKIGRGLKDGHTIPVRMSETSFKQAPEGKHDGWVTNKGYHHGKEKPEGHEAVTSSGAPKTVLANKVFYPGRGSSVRGSGVIGAFAKGLGVEEFSLYEKWLAENKPSDREIGKPSLTRIYAAETPGEGKKEKKK